MFNIGKPRRTRLVIQARPASYLTSPVAWPNATTQVGSSILTASTSAGILRRRSPAAATLQAAFGTCSSATIDCSLPKEPPPVRFRYNLEESMFQDLSTTEQKPMMAASTLLECLNRDGFVVIPSILTEDQLAKLREATQAAAAAARAGKWPNVRTLPKQFPPWPLAGPDPPSEGIWGVQGMMHPDMPNSDVFVQTYFSDAVIEPTKQLLQCTDDELVMELFNLLIRPDHDFELRWHRDDIPATATADEELDRLNRPALSAQWNLALYDDSSLIVVPGSHTRARTDVERNADPYEKDIPDQLFVELKAGDIVFYNNNILHRGAYLTSKERMTLHGSAGHVNGSTLRARNVLQHGLKGWADKIDLGALTDCERRRAESMRRMLVKLGQEAGEVGYSLEG